MSVDSHLIFSIHSFQIFTFVGCGQIYGKPLYFLLLVPRVFDKVIVDGRLFLQ